jgi:predicted transcriptional regulator
MPQTKHASTFRLSDTALMILDDLSEKKNMTKTEVLEKAIRKVAWYEGHRAQLWRLNLLAIHETDADPFFVLPTVDEFGDPGLYGSAHYVRVERRGEVWHAHVRDMPCEATGGTREEAGKHLLDAVRAYFNQKFADDLLA